MVFGFATVLSCAALMGDGRGLREEYILGVENMSTQYSIHGKNKWCLQSIAQIPDFGIQLLRDPCLGFPQTVSKNDASNAYLSARNKSRCPLCVSTSAPRSVTVVRHAKASRKASSHFRETKPRRREISLALGSDGVCYPSLACIKTNACIQPYSNIRHHQNCTP
jgi:hypothetical protein